MKQGLVIHARTGARGTAATKTCLAQSMSPKLGEGLLEAAPAFVGSSVFLTGSSRIMRAANISSHICRAAKPACLRAWQTTPRTDATVGSITFLYYGGTQIIPRKFKKYALFELVASPAQCLHVALNAMPPPSRCISQAPSRRMICSAVSPRYLANSGTGLA